jgi:hypothetical protein
MDNQGGIKIDILICGGHWLNGRVELSLARLKKVRGINYNCLLLYSFVVVSLWTLFLLKYQTCLLAIFHIFLAVTVRNTGLLVGYVSL